MDIDSRPSEIYYALRNAMLVMQLTAGEVDNYKLKQNLVNSLGEDLITGLIDDTASNLEKKLALSYLNLLVNYLENKLKESKWEKIAISSH